MHAPTNFPQVDPVPAAVRAAERAILDAEGPSHVSGVYYAREADAAQQRRWAAERVVRETALREAWAASHPVPAAPRVSTWLLPRERAQLDAAAAGGRVGGVGDALAPTHRDALTLTRRDVALGDADAVLVSAARVTAGDVRALAEIVRGFPAVPVAGYVGDGSLLADALTGALLLGHAGVTMLVDCRTPRGWAALRDALAPGRLTDAFRRACVAAILADLRASSDGGDAADGAGAKDSATGGNQIADGLARFFVAAFASDVTSAKQVAARLGVAAPTLSSRFFRAGLPSPRRYVALARMVWVARLGEAPGLSLAAIALRLDASSSQSFYRTVRAFTGMAAAEFRRVMTGEAMLARYRAELIAPHRDRLRAFDPTGLDAAPVRVPAVPVTRRAA